MSMNRKLPLMIGVSVLLLGGGYWSWNLWQEGRVPPGPPHVAGRILFSTKKCVRCHKVAGVGGLVGADLTVVALKRTAEWMDAYMEDPRAVKSDAEMPRPKLTGPQREAILAYLETLNGITPPELPEP